MVTLRIGNKTGTGCIRFTGRLLFHHRLQHKRRMGMSLCLLTDTYEVYQRPGDFVLYQRTDELVEGYQRGTCQPFPSVYSIYKYMQRNGPGWLADKLVDTLTTSMYEDVPPSSKTDAVE